MITSAGPHGGQDETSASSRRCDPGRGGKLSGVTADEPLDPADGGIVASTAAVLALRDLLVEKGVITPDEFDEALGRHSAFIIEQLRQRRDEEAQNADRSWSRWRDRAPGSSAPTSDGSYPVTVRVPVRGDSPLACPSRGWSEPPPGPRPGGGSAWSPGIAEE